MSEIPCLPSPGRHSRNAAMHATRERLRTRTAETRAKSVSLRFQGAPQRVPTGLIGSPSVAGHIGATCKDSMYRSYPAANRRCDATTFHRTIHRSRDRPPSDCPTTSTYRQSPRPAPNRDPRRTPRPSTRNRPTLHNPHRRDARLLYTGLLPSGGNRAEGRWQ